MSQPVTQPAQHGDMGAYPTPQPSAHGSPINTQELFEPNLLVPADHNYNPIIYADMQRAWSLILPNDLSQYKWDMKLQNAWRHCPFRPRGPSDEPALNERDDNDPPAFPPTGPPPPPEMLSATDPIPTTYDDDQVHDANDDGIHDLGDTQERNLTVGEFIRQWYIRAHFQNERNKLNGPLEDVWPSIGHDAVYVNDWVRPKKISRPANVSSRAFDIQGIPWSTKLKTRRREARDLRDATYKSYHNISGHSPAFPCDIPSSEDFYIAKAMYTKYKANMEHFQLRYLLSATASNTVHYARDSKVYSATPFYEEEHCIMDLSDPDGSGPFLDYVKITTLKAKHGITIVGGFEGEYAYRADMTSDIVAEGFVTPEPRGIVTHVDIVKNRTSDMPNAIIATNDAEIHILDCETQTFIDRQRFAHPVNCTATSPDRNLRVIIGDACNAWIIDSAGKPVHELTGHVDFGFACAWSSNSLHVATANQDRTVNIWDVRMWRRLTTIDSDVSCYRSLKYSPLGSGPSTLLMCEPADRIVLVNADDYYTRQVHDFFGEIGGADFTPDGGRIWVANMDPEFGGLIEYERNDEHMPF